MSAQPPPSSVEGPGPARGTLPPRTWCASSDAAHLSLNGSWHSRPGRTGPAYDESFSAPGCDAAGWDRVEVPGRPDHQLHPETADCTFDFLPVEGS
ncbi:hypothetical protein [Streptomyces sp. NPDC058657]|uniref:hypothetical protein n=1 Tax=unclassified Streptomyces TaxID=2593676 RepID=UPI00364C6FB2